MTFYLKLKIFSQISQESGREKISNGNIDLPSFERLRPAPLSVVVGLMTLNLRVFFKYS